MGHKNNVLIFVAVGLALAAVVYFYLRSADRVVPPVDDGLSENSMGHAVEFMEKEPVHDNGMPSAVPATSTDDISKKIEINGMPSAVPATSTDDISKKIETNGMPSSPLESAAAKQ